jgi:type II secretory pathway pseudopilin PulG
MRKNRGSAMLALMVVLTVAGYIAAQVAPVAEVREKRRVEDRLRMALSEIRQAMELRGLSDPTYYESLDLRDHTKIHDELKDLVKRNFLRSESIMDATLSGETWGTSDQFFWQANQNILHNSSFEFKTSTQDLEVLPSWSLGFGTNNTQLKSDTVFFPSRNTATLDDYPGQNKLGEPFTSKGTSIMLTR